MAMILIEKKEIEENGVVYIVETYQSNKTGKKSVVKYPKPSEVTPEPVEPEPTDEELQAEMLLMQTEIIANQNAQDEVLAEILLNQIGG